MKIRFLVVALICTAAVAAGSAQAQPRNVIVVTPHNLAFGAPTSECHSVNLFDLFDISGSTLLGTGTACIKQELVEPGCGEPPLQPPFTPGCRQLVELVLTLQFSDGSLTIPTVFDEIFSSPFSLVNIAHGRVRHGTGAYSAYRGRKGTLEGAGSTFLCEPQSTPLCTYGIDTTIVWVIRGVPAPAIAPEMSQ
jgi:hypothetical protein